MKMFIVPVVAALSLVFPVAAQAEEPNPTIEDVRFWAEDLMGLKPGHCESFGAEVGAGYNCNPVPKSRDGEDKWQDVYPGEQPVGCATEPKGEVTDMCYVYGGS